MQFICLSKNDLYATLDDCQSVDGHFLHRDNLILFLEELIACLPLELLHLNQLPLKFSASVHLHLEKVKASVNGLLHANLS
jgi:hypothetical protein